METVKTTFDVGAMFFYKADQIMLHVNMYASSDGYFAVYDVAADAFGTEMFSQVTNVKDAAYSSYTDEIYFSAYDVAAQTMNVKALDMETGNIQTLKMRSVSDANSATMRFVEASGNIIAVNRADSVMDFIDVDELAKNTITIGTYGYTQDSMRYLLTQYNLQYDGAVSEVNFTDKEKMQLKLLAGDTDVDLYVIPSYMNIVNYINNHAYEDLCAYESLQKYWDLPLLQATVDVGGSVFGVPIDTSLTSTESFMIQDEMYLYLHNLRQYVYENIDLQNKVYADTNGDRLLDVLNHIKAADIHSDAYAKPKNGHYSYIISDYIILNPASEKKEQSVAFLQFVLQELSSEENAALTENSSLMVTYYPQFDDYTNTYIDWMHYDTDIYVELNEFAHSYVQNGDASGLSALCNKIKIMVME